MKGTSMWQLRLWSDHRRTQLSFHSSNQFSNRSTRWRKWITTWLTWRKRNQLLIRVWLFWGLARPKEKLISKTSKYSLSLTKSKSQTKVALRKDITWSNSLINFHRSTQVCSTMNQLGFRHSGVILVRFKGLIWRLVKEELKIRFYMIQLAVLIIILAEWIDYDLIILYEQQAAIRYYLTLLWV